MANIFASWEDVRHQNTAHYHHHLVNGRSDWNVGLQMIGGICCSPALLLL
jgi:hypothetical protein